MRVPFVTLVLCLTLSACSLTAQEGPRGFVPATRWDGRPEASEWTKATLAALEGEGAVLLSSVPEDIGAYCPAYQSASETKRQAFWVGLISHVAGIESGHNPKAAGGGGRYKGLMQISDGTAAANGCATGAALYDGGANLSCAVRIIAGHVRRDGEIFGGSQRGWLGLARDWLPLRDKNVRNRLADWTRTQSYCR